MTYVPLPPKVNEQHSATNFYLFGIFLVLVFITVLLGLVSETLKDMLEVMRTASWQISPAPTAKAP